MSNDQREVVGVVSDVKMNELGSAESSAAIYVPQSVARGQGGAFRRLVIRTTVPPAGSGELSEISRGSTHAASASVATAITTAGHSRFVSTATTSGTSEATAT